MAEIDYCTLAEVEAYAGINFSDGMGPSDSEIATMISTASRLMDAFGGKQFAGTETKTEYHDTSYGLAFLILNTRPVVSITTIHTIASDGAETLLDNGRIRNDDDYYLSDADAGIIRFHYAFTEQVACRLKVIYVAGAAAPPTDVKIATILHVVRSAARAALNDENCMERVKEMWKTLLADSEKEYGQMLERVKRRADVAVAAFGQFDMPTSIGYVRGD